MAHRKEQKEALRREREAREAKARAEQQRKRLVGIGGGAVLAITAIVIVVLLAGGGGDEAAGEGNFFPEDGEVPEQQTFDLDRAARAAGCELTDSRGSGVADHTTTSRRGSTTRTTRPPPAATTRSRLRTASTAVTPPPDEALVHALEHGRVIVWVKPSVPADARASIRAMFDADELPDAPRQALEHALRGRGHGLEPRPRARRDRAHAVLRRLEPTR